MNWNLWPFKHLRLFYRITTPRKSRWRPTPTLMILWWRALRRQRITQGIPLPLLRSPPSRAQCNPSWIARFRAFPSQQISLLWVSHLLTVTQALVSQNSNFSGLASSIRQKFQRKNLTGWVHWFHFVTPWFPYSTPGTRVMIAVAWLLPRFPLLPSVHSEEKKTSDRYISQMAGCLFDLQAGNCCCVSQAFHWTSKIPADY